jgi:hypothetical protein
VKFVAWYFLSTAVIGCVVFLLWLLVDDCHFRRADNLMDAQRNGGASNAPVMLGLMAIAGAYLLKDSDKRKSEGDDEHKNDPQ